MSGIDLIDLIEKYASEGGEYLLLDEVHRYEDFSSHLKTIYDLFEIKVSNGNKIPLWLFGFVY